MKISFTERVKRQLNEIYAFTATISPNAAANLYNDILDEISRLSIFPKIAAIEQLLTERPESFRSLVVRKIYKVVYYIDGDTVVIATIWDCRRNPQDLKNEI